MTDFHFAVPAWGDQHVGLMLNVMIPSLLAPGNLPALADPSRCRFVVYTSREDLERIEASPALAAVRRLMPTWCTAFDTSTPPDGNRHAPASAAYATALRLAHEDGAALVIPPPDCVVSDGLIATLQAHAAAGTRVVHTLGLRLEVRSTDPFMVLRNPDGALCLTPRELVTIALQRLHPINALHFWDECDPGLEPSVMLWVAPGGLLARCFHLHPVMIRPTALPDRFDGTVDWDFALRAAPDFADHAVLADSDAGCLFGLDYPDKTYPAAVARGDVDGVRRWSSGQNANDLHRWLLTHEVRIHAGDVERTVPGAGWREASEKARRVIADIREVEGVSA